MSFQGFKTTRKGRALIAKLLAEKQLEISRVEAGSGTCESEDIAYELEALIDPQMEGTSTVPSYYVDSMTMTVQFRSDLNGGVEKGFWVKEFGVFAMDPEEGEILMYYYSLGDEPQYMAGQNSKNSSVLNYPISVTVGEDIDGVNLGYPASAFLMPKDLVEHNEDPNAHSGALGSGISLVSSLEEMEDLPANAFGILVFSSVDDDVVVENEPSLESDDDSSDKEAEELEEELEDSALDELEEDEENEAGGLEESS